MAVFLSLAPLPAAANGGEVVTSWAAIAALVLAIALFCGMKRAHARLAAAHAAHTAKQAAAEQAAADAALLSRRIRELSAEIEAHRLEAQKLAEAAHEVTRAKEAAEAANRSKTQFLAMMSHELRTPLNAILGFSEIIRSEALGKLGADEYREYAQDIYSSGSHLLALINDLLDLAKVESGMVDIREEMVDPTTMLGDSVRIVGKTDAARGVALSVDAEADLPQLRADKRKLRQVLMNVLSNAVKFTPEGGAVTARAYAEADGGVAFEIADQGIGIAEADLAKVMEPFVQIDSDLNRAQPGTGLGLPLCKQLTELHGGRFDIESVLNEGTVVRIVMPAKRSMRRGGEAAA